MWFILFYSRFPYAAKQQVKRMCFISIWFHKLRRKGRCKNWKKRLPVLKRVSTLLRLHKITFQSIFIMLLENYAFSTFKRHSHKTETVKLQNRRHTGERVYFMSSSNHFQTKWKKRPSNKLSLLLMVFMSFIADVSPTYSCRLPQDNALTTLHAIYE